MNRIDAATSWTASAGAYVSLLPLSSGGMGSVEIALREDSEFTRVVAVKRLHPHLLDDENFVAMFVDEARLAAMIRHVNVVGVLDVGSDERGPFFVMDYVEGLSLSKVLQHHGKRGELMPLQVCLRITKQICDGLHAAHELRTPDGAPVELVHRDVSPQNVIVGFDGVARVLDFGVAKALGRITKTAVGTLKGKLGYMPPEQLRYETPDRRSDLFSVGVLAHEMITGQRLYDGPIESVARRILVEPPPDLHDARSDVPDALVELSFELLAKDRDGRPRTAHEVSRRLDAMIADCVADEGSIELAEYVRHAFAAEIEETRAALAAAMHDRSGVRERKAPLAPLRIDSSAPTRALGGHETSKPRARRLVWLAGAGCTLLIAVAAWSTTRSVAPPSASLASIESPPHTAPLPLPSAGVEPGPSSTALPLPAPSAGSLAPRPKPRAAKPADSKNIPLWKW